MTEQMNVPKLRFGEFQGGWSKISIDGLNIDVIDGDRGTHYPTKEELLPEGSCLFLSAKNVTKSGFQFSEKQFITEEKDKLLRKGKLKRGDIVLTTRGSVGHKALYAETVEYDSLRINSGMVLLRHPWEELSNDFVYKSMFTRHFTKQIDVVAFGSAQPALTVKEIKKLKLSIPPSFQEQQKIASFLSKVDEKIALLTEKKAKLTEYKKGVMQQLFDGKWQEQDGKLVFVPPTLRFKADDGSEFPDWEEKKLSVLTTKISDGIHSTPTYDDEGDYFFVNGNNLKEGNIVIDQNTKRVSDSEALKHHRPLSEHSILMSINGTIGNMATYAEQPIMLGKSACYINVNPRLANKMFIYAYLQLSATQFYFTKELTGSTIKNLSLKAVKETVVKTPCLGEQKKIANFLSAIDQKIYLANSELEKANEWKKGLLQQMFV
ncbi:restriction endonuclease subunit S [Vibrio parahaemolyticus]|uniref:restriction endonuclease subunit S n=1 Tax=Vibrio parahaemolyticus TaxID=670 RepID=UPI00041ECF6F|nr:restriction endonuclease subunit S [Vibrio parahaemolyticus]